MSLRRTIRDLIHKASGVHILRRLPPGSDVHQDIRFFLPEVTVRCVFDVGANVGQSAREYLRHYPGAQIHSFEPASATFAKLETAFAGEPNVHCWNLAMGSRDGEADLFLADSSDMNRLADGSGAGRTERIRVETIDGFCARHRIEDIDLLKIDTEGHDLDVLTGAETMLAASRVGLVQVEAAMNPGNRHHVAFERFREYLEPKGYVLFKLYRQMHEWPTDQPALRRADAVFLSAKLNRAAPQRKGALSR